VVEIRIIVAATAMFAALAGWTATAQIPPPSQQGSQPPPASSTPSGAGALASIAGVIRLNGTPAASTLVALVEGNIETKHCETDASGHYSFSDVTPGRVQLRFKSQSGGGPYLVSIVLQPGEKKFNSNLTITEPGRISGKITDEDKNPLKGIRVGLISAEYFYGALRYTISGTATTNEAGEYTVADGEAGRAHFVLASSRLSYSQAISGVAVDPAQRQPILMPAYYPGADSVDSAMPVIVAPGGKRELVDIQMRRSPSQCLEGKIGPSADGGPVHFEIGENEPPLWASGASRARIVVQPRIVPGDGGKIRICDLHQGGYWLKTYSAGDNPNDHAIEYVSIGDKDVSGIEVNTPRQFPVEGKVVWDGKAPDDPVSAQIEVGITSTIGEFGNVSVHPSGTIPLDFALPVSNHGYILAVAKIPAGAFVKDVTYGGRSILNQVFEPGASAAFDGLRIVLAGDGGRVSLRAADKDGNAVADATVVIMPTNATSEAAMASAMVTGQTDGFGAWTSGPIAPGKYYVIATPMPVNRSFDTIAKLWRARGAAEVVELGAGATVQVSRVPVAIE
jgi:hypothetical protein